MGAGCVGSNGLATLEPWSLPWVDADFAGQASGLPFGVAISIYGFTHLVPGFPLDAVFSEALPGCDVHVSLDVLIPLNASTGVAFPQVFLADTPPLVGVTFYHQVIGFGAGEIVATNALQLTAGAF